MLCSSRVTVAVCDPNEISRMGVSAALAAHGFEVSVSVGSVSAARDALATTPPRVALIDILLGSPADVMALIRHAAAAASVIAVGAQADRTSVLMAVQAGAIGFLTKDMPAGAWASSIEGAVRGEAVLSRSLAAMVVTQLQAHAAAIPDAVLLPSDRRLTQREWEVLERIAAGDTNRRVAADLCISIETVRSHVSNILAKLEAPNRSAAAARYQQLRLARAV